MTDDDAVRVAAAGHLVADVDIDVQEVAIHGLDSGRVGLTLRTSAGDVGAYLEASDARGLVERLEAAIAHAEAARDARDDPVGAVRVFVQEAGGHLDVVDAETVAGSLGISLDAAEAALESLAAEGELVQDDDGIYRVSGTE